MKNLKIKFALLLIFLITSCSTSSYKVSKKMNGKYELALTPDRILLECEYLFKEADYELYGFMIHVLDEENTVFTAIHGSNLEKKSCFDRIKTIEKILKRGKNIYFAGIGDLEEPRKNEEPSYTFPGIGTYRSNGRVLSFFAIANELGDCFETHSKKNKPCPHYEFPIDQ